MHSTISDIFGRFQNLNLVVLIEDLRRNLTAAGNWASGDLLCPVAHGMPDGAAIERLKYLSQAVNLDAACRYAACELGTHDVIVRRFVDQWDATPAAAWLLNELEQIWAERLEDALFMTDLLQLDGGPVVDHAGKKELLGSPAR